LLLAPFALLLPSPMLAQGTRTPIDLAKLGPQVGERVPDFRLFDQTGRERTLQSIMGRRGAMLVFVRSAEW
jgi:peroxiredoxin